MQGRSGISDKTKDRFILDAGQVFANVDLTELESGAFEDAIADAVNLGATRGGNSFSPGRTLRDIEVDGTLGPVVGLKRRSAVEPTLTVNLIEMTVDNFKKAIAGAIATAAGAGGYEKITGGEVLDDHYLDNVAIVTTYTGSNNPIIIGVKNALVTESPEFATNDQDETVMAVTFAGHFAGAEATEEPWFIYHPGEAEPAP